jgi:DNA polymerase (family 10)
MDNLEIARLLEETADLMEIGGEDAFRIRSYRNAARVIESAAEPVASIVKDPARDVTSLAGIGKGIAGALHEIVERGSFARRDEILERYPPTALEMLKISGLGVKTVRALWEHFRVSTMDDLERLCLDGRLQELPRMSAKQVEKILEGIARYRRDAGLYLRGLAQTVADELGPQLASTAAGELRRGQETISELLLVSARPDAAALFSQYPRAHDVTQVNDADIRARVGLEGLPVRLRVVAPDAWGTALVQATGSAAHLSSLGALPVAATEEALYAALGLAWIPPELRENRGEIEAARAGISPQLVELADRRGDLHMHTRESDGRATLEEMAAAALARGHAYIAVTDHSKALAMANGLDERRAVEFAARVREFNREEHGIRVFSGLECDILRDGRMDLAEDALAELDFVIASVHSHMGLEPAEMTDRLLRALSSPSVRVMGHPTGRVLLHREAYRYDFERVAAEAARRGVWMEINSSPERLDLHADLIRAARALGCRFTISTDAHHPSHLANLRHGVAMARRGGLTRADILNTLAPDAFAAALQRSSS